MIPPLLTPYIVYNTSSSTDLTKCHHRSSVIGHHRSERLAGLDILLLSGGILRVPRNHYYCTHIVGQSSQQQVVGLRDRVAIIPAGRRGSTYI